MLDTILSNLKKFRQQIYNSILYRRDATMDLIDSLCSNITADSPVKLSLNKHHRRTYNSITDVISEFHNGGEEQDNDLFNLLINQAVKDNNARNYYLFATDCTSAPRTKAKTLSDRSIVYAPNPIAGNKPITIGHKYSLNVYLPARDKLAPTWCLPLTTKRVCSDADETLLGAAQLQQALNAINKKETNKLCVSVVDSGYCKPEYIDKLYACSKNKNLISIIRARSNRVVWRKSKVKHSVYARNRGHELWYGEKFDFKDEDSWHKPDKVFTDIINTKTHKECTLNIESWDNMLMRQKRCISMNNYPFTLHRVTITDKDGKYIFHKPLWLMVFGERRQEIISKQIYQDYMQRYDIEHFFKFDKSRLLTDKLQTSDTQHEENWWELCSLAYSMLFTARLAADKITYPWEKYLPQAKQDARIPSVSQVQRSFGKITDKVGTPAPTPKLRGNPLGRKPGDKQAKRIRYSVLIKSKISPENAVA